MLDYEIAVDKILQHFAGDKFRKEIIKAKKEFFDNAGILDENSEQYELRMAQFFDWYFFTRDLSGYAQTPLESAHLERELRFSPEELDVIERLKNHRHSLFEFKKIKDRSVYLKDLVRNEKIIVKNSPWIYGFDENEIIEARLIPSGDSYIFTKGMCFHPKEVKKFILSEVKKHRKDPDLNPEDLMLRLLKMRYKFDQYRHVSLGRIYTNNNQLGV